jgi:hypothetical protein
MWILFVFSSSSFCLKIKLKDISILNANAPPFTQPQLGSLRPL